MHLKRIGFGQIKPSGVTDWLELKVICDCAPSCNYVNQYKKNKPDMKQLKRRSVIANDGDCSGD